MVFVFLLTGCEAPLDLSGVAAEKAKPTHRSDLFQAIARFKDQVVVVGGMGSVVQSADGGKQWHSTTLAGRPYLVDVTACPDGTFYAIDKTDGIWSLQNDGKWSRQPLPEGTEPQAMTCNSDGVLWVVGGFSTILHSLDKGASWDSWSLDDDLYLTTIQFLDEQHGFATGEFGTVLVSEDGGVSWQRATELPNSFYPQSAYFKDASTGWVVGLSGTIWKTTDAAQTWNEVPSGITTPLYGITGLGDTLVAVGDNTIILVLRLEDGNWRRLGQTVVSRTYLRGVIGLDRSHFIAAGGGGSLFPVTIPDAKPLASAEANAETNND